ncbi:hypothetical protein SESBI_26067 [Sesbania bispinosa]|nr:hypothetical protein SESBI_26067 [Sesbania bispinosa]
MAEIAATLRNGVAVLWQTAIPHTAWLQWRICDGGAIAATMTMAAWRKVR